MDFYSKNELTPIYKFLSSGLIKGIGVSTAKKIIGKFKEKTLEVLESKPEKLMEIDGIKKKKYEIIKKSLDEYKGAIRVIAFLKKYDVDIKTILRIYDIFRDDAVILIKNNPYLLIEVPGINFITADMIAKNMGIPADSDIRIAAGIKYILQKALEEGHVFLPMNELILLLSRLLSVDKERLCYIVDKALNQGFIEDVVLVKIKDESRVYLKSYYFMEKSIAKMLYELNQEKDPIEITMQDIENIEKKSGVKLAERQREALLKAAQNRILIITGGPGTGKTTIIKCITEFFKSKKMKVALCAPTGRASKRMAEATSFEAVTIHRLLEYNSETFEGFGKSKENPLEEDVVIVDETSMVDVSLMYHLLSALKKDARIILVGDKDQLPSVGPGNVLKDLITSEKIETVFLDQIFRQAKESLITVNAHRINKGLIPFLNKKDSDFFLLQADTPEEILEKIIELVTVRIPQYGNFDPNEDIQVITPMKKTLIGVENLNKKLQEVLNPGTKDKKELVYNGLVFRENDKVMQIKNNYQKEVFNGDVGRIVKIKNHNEIIVAYQDVYGLREVTYREKEKEEITLAYALSVHKSQGSEYPVVVMPISFAHYPMLDRNLLYTAITRAKKLMVLIGTKQALFYAIKNIKKIKRNTGLKDFLEEENEGIR